MWSYEVLSSKTIEHNELNASRLVGKAREPELGFAFSASLISTVQPNKSDRRVSLFWPKMTESLPRA